MWNKKIQKFHINATMWYIYKEYRQDLEANKK